MVVEPAAGVRPVKRCGRLRPARRRVDIPLREQAKRGNRISSRLCCELRSTTAIFGQRFQATQGRCVRRGSRRSTPVGLRTYRGGSNFAVNGPRRARRRPPVDWPWLTVQPARKRRPQPRQRESDRSQPGISVIFGRKVSSEFHTRASVDHPVRN